MKINTFTPEDFKTAVETIVAEVTIGKRAEDGDAKTFQVNVAEMHFAALEKVIRYGIQRAVNDPIGGKDKTLADKFEAAEDIILSWYSGEFKARKNAAPKLSDEAAFKRAFVLAELKKVFIAKNSKDAWKTKTEGDSGAAFIAAIIEKHGVRYESAATEAWNAELAKRANVAKLSDEIDFDI
jgi:hypothetical protein